MTSRSQTNEQKEKDTRINVEKIERLVVERVLSISPGLASAEVVYTTPFELPVSQVKVDAYTGLLIVGKGKVIEGASAQAMGLPSLKGSVHEKNVATNYFALVAGDEVQVYLDQRAILQI